MRSVSVVAVAGFAIEFSNTGSAGVLGSGAVCESWRILTLR